MVVANKEEVAGWTLKAAICVVSFPRAGLLNDDKDEGGYQVDGGGGGNRDGHDKGARHPLSSTALVEETGEGVEEEQLRLDPKEVLELKALLPSLRRLREEDGDAAVEKGVACRQSSQRR